MDVLMVNTVVKMLVLVVQIEYMIVQMDGFL